MTMLQKLATALLDARSWWWQSGIVEDDLILDLLLTLSVSLFALFSFIWIHKYTLKNTTPPLPPGPRGLPLVGNLLSLDPELHTYFATLARTYGPILTLRLGTKVNVVVTSPAVAREVLKDHDTTFANRDVPVAARISAYGAKDIVWTPYGPEWRMLRKVFVREMLSNTSLDSVYTLRRREIRRTIGYLYRRVSSPVNVGEQMFFSVANVITSMLWGGSVKGEEERGGVGREFRQVVSEMTELLGKPNKSDFYPGLAWFDLQGTAKQMKGLVHRFDGIFDAVINRRVKMDGSESKDFLQFLLKLKDEGNEEVPFTMTHLKALLMDMVVSGTETTSNTVEFAMAEIMNKPQTMKKAQQELDAIVGKNNMVEESHIQKLPYLYAVMKDSLRLHPVLPLLVPHCPSKSCVIGGYTIPKGTSVLVNVWAIHRDPSVWESPLEFIPERFLDSERDFSGKDLIYFPFGPGRRICAGMAMAERMVMFSLASLLHSFDWKLGEGEKMDLSEKFGIVLQKKVPLVAIPVPRISDPELYQYANM